MVEGHYEFGQNWSSFIEHHLNDERVDEALQSLQRFCRLESFAGLRFLDIGCGSGLFSLAAHRLGAKEVHSLDIDGDSVACCRTLWQREGEPENWKVFETSVLDRPAMEQLGEFDLVYSWGVLHHTGDMWQAILNAGARVAPGGLFYIALYNSADGIGLYADGRAGSSRFWEWEKRLYTSLPSWGRRMVDAGAASAMVLGYLVAGRNPVTEIRQHKSLRGMSWMVDIRDWLGGHPYEYASVEEVFKFVHDNLGFSLENLISTNTLRNNEFLFRRAK